MSKQELIQILESEPDNKLEALVKIASMFSAEQLVQIAEKLQNPLIKKAVLNYL